MITWNQKLHGQLKQKHMLCQVVANNVTFVTEKLTILMADPKSTLNKRDEIMAKCKHKRKYILGTVKPNITEQEPPDPT